MRYGILADVHANLEALQAVLEDGKSRVDDWWLLGDAVGRGPDPVEILLLLRKHVSFRHWQMGNHDLYVSQWAAPVGVNEWDKYTDMCHRDALRKDRKNGHVPLLWAWCRRNWRLDNAAPRHLPGKDVEIYLVHGGLESQEMNAGVNGEYLYPWDIVMQASKVTLQGQYLQKLHNENTDVKNRTAVLIHGHTHVPYLACQARFTEYPVLAPIRYDCKPTPLSRFEIVFINPGSVGFPRNGDELVHAAYGILDTNADTFEFRRVCYDSESTRSKITQKPLYDIRLVRLLEGNHPGNPLRDRGMWDQWNDNYTRRDWGWQPTSS